jgi:hypothetical protein
VSGRWRRCPEKQDPERGQPSSAVPIQIDSSDCIKQVVVRTSAWFRLAGTFVTTMIRCAVVTLLLYSCLWTLCAGADSSTTGTDELAKKVLVAAKLQQVRKPSAPVVSDLVKEAPPAELANGDADISTTGACAADRDALCPPNVVPPGEGRLAKCIRTRIKNEERGNVTGRRVTKKCKLEVEAFYADRGTNVNKNLQLASSCKSDITKLCSKLSKQVADKPGAVLSCLRSNKKKLQAKCKLQVTKAQIAAAYDYNADSSLAAECKADAQRICSEVAPGDGRVQACLVRLRALLDHCVNVHASHIVFRLDMFCFYIGASSAVEA